MSLQDIMKAISDPTRREILNMLRKQPLTAGEIVQAFDMTNASISHHLSILKQADLVMDEKKGKYITYELNTSVIEEILVWLQSLRGDDYEED
ncbi:autorepressor SdpR family transcription factor [Chakrabartyella piscis]|uniref:autorepressor SdpR family transcription factor n=1 Tax=Chakrabartyella piscis TaxID=2918914 RepID=UPI00295875B3|nr:autorepressor SdpR family transcription factor [Chakrabartyella piscis]